MGNRFSPSVGGPCGLAMPCVLVSRRGKGVAHTPCTQLPLTFSPALLQHQMPF